MFSDCFYADDVTTVTSETFTEDPSKIFFYFLALTLWLEGFRMMSVKSKRKTIKEFQGRPW